jgi:hypothetical protein
MACCERAAAAVVIAAVAAGAPGPARAACPTATQTWSDAETPQRISTLQGALDAEAQRARRWRWAWTGINGGLTAFSFGSMPLVSRQSWPELVVGGVGSALSTALTIAWPLDVEAATRMRATAGSCDELQALEVRAGGYGRDERDRLRWPWHLLNVGVGAAYFAILGFGYHHWGSGAWAGVSALVIGEAQTLTQPTGGTRLAGPVLIW